MTLEDLDAETGELAEMIATNAIVDPRTIRMRHSILKQIALSPAHLLHACQQPQDDSLAARLGSFALDKKDALRFGTAVHLMLLGDSGKVARCSIRRDMRTKQFQAYTAEAEKNGVTTILSEREHFLADSIVDAVRRKDRAMELLFGDNAIREQTIEFDFLGRAFRATPDSRTPRRIVDLKTSRSSNPAWFKREALRLHYETQACVYREAVGPTVEECFLVVVEKSPPWPVTIFRFDDEVLDRGDRILRLWMESLNVCEASNQWPEYALGDVLIELEQDAWGEAA